MKELIRRTTGFEVAMEPDKDHVVCSSTDNDTATLPRYARLPINRCNLPAIILGSLTFQHAPAPLQIDGVAELHRDLFRRLDNCDEREKRAEVFGDYLTVRFCLEDLAEAGLTERSEKRANANWMRVLRGWSFNSDSREGAILKGWVESRFGLLPRFHKEPLRDFSGAAYLRYLEMRSSGLYGTNALESQLDLVFSYGQYEYQRSQQAGESLLLYRGINRLNEHEVLSKTGKRQIVLFNNLTSFTASRERASEFGDYILSTRVPTDKIFFHHDLVPGVLKGEDEYLVIGGIYDVDIRTF
ncbi:NAD(+)--dinitrogen-reductase ADP-D-ribosyltransferase [Propionivibrio limicola]|uniref:NAD(+)--dinitrogen-reductase ADP-D-ribosyltransferase n=1 Tax=Propionivibrio limicola TaxID=167645 RepID=UPI001B87E113|nr:NAD(+)--dinitrogen-reductase ADP-D-ribosyltransferase [Propionivibrio limicola]